jgi:hypothetical protein
MTNQNIADSIIKLLFEVGIDGETMEYIINKLGMRDQMIKQLTPQGDIVELERGKSIVAAVFTKDSLIEYTRTIQERCKQAITEAIDNAGIEGDEYMELELDYNNTIQTNFDDRALIKEIESIIDDVFETDDDSVFDEATNVITFMSKR